MNPSDNQGYRTNESVGKMFLHSCLGKFIIFAGILVVLFILAAEMILGRDIIKNEPTSSGASIVPIAFPLIAGPGAITAFISLHAE